MVVFIIGKSGSGKTYLAQDIVTSVLPYKKVWIINNNSEYATNIKSIINIPIEQPGKIDYFKLIDSPYNVNLELLLLENDRNAEIDAICKAVLMRGNMLLVVDEARIHYPQFRHSLELERVITTGRKYGIDSIFVTQIGVMVNRTVDSQASYVISFQLTRKPEVERMELFFGDEAKKLTRFYDHQFLITDFNRGRIGKGRL